MNERDMRSTAEDAGRRVAESAQDTAARAGAYMQSQASRASERMQDLAADARGQVVRLTGKPLESWTADARRYVTDHPVQAVAITIGVGYLLGKLMQRRD